MYFVYLSHNVTVHRKDGDQAKANSYVDAFSKSCITSQLIERIANEIGMERNFFAPDFSDPVALISELLWYLYVLYLLIYQNAYDYLSTLNFVWLCFSIKHINMERLQSHINVEK